MISSEEGVVQSGSLAYLCLWPWDDSGTARFMCLSETFSGGAAPKFAAARLCTSDTLSTPIVVRARPLNDRRATLPNGTRVGSETFIAFESSQVFPGQGHPFILAVGTGGDAAVAEEMWRDGFPTPNQASAAALASDVPMQTPLFVANSRRPELSAFILMNVKGDLRYGEPFQLLTHYGYLRQAHSRFDHLTLMLEPDPHCAWRLLPYRTTYSSFSEDGCLAHRPNPVPLLGLKCSSGAASCAVGGKRLFLTRAECEGDEAAD